MPLLYYRQATKTDAPALKEIAQRVIRTNYVSFLGIDATTAFIESGMSDQEIEAGLDHCTLVVLEEQILGFAITHEEVLHVIMIDVPFQHAGYGAALLSHIEAKLFSHYNSIRLQTFEGNALSVQFYEKQGWVIRQREEVPEWNQTMLQFEKVKNPESTHPCESR